MKIDKNQQQPQQKKVNLLCLDHAPHCTEETTFLHLIHIFHIF